MVLSRLVMMAAPSEIRRRVDRLVEDALQMEGVLGLVVVCSKNGSHVLIADVLLVGLASVMEMLLVRQGNLA